MDLLHHRNVEEEGMQEKIVHLSVWAENDREKERKREREVREIRTDSARSTEHIKKCEQKKYSLRVAPDQ